MQYIDATAKMYYTVTVNLRPWRNWQTRRTKDPVLHGVMVQVHSVAPHYNFKKMRSAKSKFDFGTLFVFDFAVGFSGLF